MPEGDALHRVAARLQVLVGQRVEASSPNPRGVATGVARAIDGRVLESVEAVGKHVLLRFEGGVTVRSHLRMNGRWRVRARDERPWSGSPWLVLSTPRFEATQWNGPVLTLDGRRRPARARSARRGDAGRGRRLAPQDGRSAPPARRRPRRPACGLGHREHLAGRAALAGSAVAVAAARRGDGRGARRGARVGARGDARVGRRHPFVQGRVPPDRTTVPPLWRSDSLPRARRCESHGLLVRVLPARSLSARRAGIGARAE